MSKFKNSFEPVFRESNSVRREMNSIPKYVFISPPRHGYTIELNIKFDSLKNGTKGFFGKFGKSGLCRHDEDTSLNT